jgi:hypothetical protein
MTSAGLKDMMLGVKLIVSDWAAEGEVYMNRLDDASTAISYNQCEQESSDNHHDDYNQLSDRDSRNVA